MKTFSLDHEVRVNAAAVRRLRRGHLWIYSGDMENEPLGIDPAFVRVLDKAGNDLGTAFYSRQSQIRLRLFTRSPETPSPELLHHRILKSVERRKSLSSCSAGRLVFGEGDLLPGIIVDRYADRLVLQTLTAGAEALKPWIVDILEEILRPAGILLKNDVKARRLEGLEEDCSVLRGSIPEELEIAEDGIQFLVNLREGQKTGFFLDQRENRIAAQKHVFGKALDCFTHTGAFALHFASRCNSVRAIDISTDSLQLARRNGALNSYDNIEFIEANVFDYLREIEREGERFNTICLDPPAFAKNRKSLPGARSGYKEINLRALKLLKPEGVLITSSCSYHMSEAELFDLICEAARDCHRYIQVIEKRGQAEDHPILGGMPETCYLKCFFLRAL